MEIQSVIGVSLLFKSINEDNLGISRSFIVPFRPDVEALNNEINRVRENYESDSEFIGIEDIFQVTLTKDENERPIYGKNYIEPITKEEVKELVLDPDELDKLIQSKTGEKLIVNLVYFSSDHDLSITCLTCLNLDHDKPSFKKNDMLFQEFESNAFKAKFINSGFDGVSPEEFKFYGVETVYNSDLQTKKEVHNFLTMYNDNITKEDLTEMIMSEKDVIDSISECEEWLSIFN